MAVKAVAEGYETPANGSRFHSSREEALQQPTGLFELAWDDEDPFLFNLGFDESLILFDDSYCTTVVDLQLTPQIPTLTYFDRVLASLPPLSRVTDIGCGQGEFVRALRNEGLNATGFDPVLRQTDPHLHQRLWNPSDGPADLYVMRCVLPHLPHPWAFLNSLSVPNSRSLVLIEYQAIEWLVANGVWYGLGHGHVNYFSAHDFEARYSVVDGGTFANGEWAWVLIDPGTYSPAGAQTCLFQQDVAKLIEERKRVLTRAHQEGRPIALWGGAGKGIILGHALMSSGVDVRAVIDAAPVRWGQFLEVSGLPVLSPLQALTELAAQTLVLVCNPNHLDEVEVFVQARLEVCSPGGL